jgi:metal-responsive CopG/Arc/MetJ family transcriptional regulator
MTKANSVGISLPTEIISKLDTERGDIPRSRYILRVLRDTYSKRNKPKEEERSSTATKIINRQDSPDCGIETPKARRIIKTEPIGAHATI